MTLLRCGGATRWSVARAAPSCATGHDVLESLHGRHTSSVECAGPCSRRPGQRLVSGMPLGSARSSGRTTRRSKAGSWGAIRQGPRRWRCRLARERGPAPAFSLPARSGYVAASGRWRCRFERAYIAAPAGRGQIVSWTSSPRPPSRGHTITGEMAGKRIVGWFHLPAGSICGRPFLSRAAEMTSEGFGDARRDDVDADVFRPLERQCTTGGARPPSRSHMRHVTGRDGAGVRPMLMILPRPTRIGRGAAAGRRRTRLERGATVLSNSSVTSRAGPCRSTRRCSRGCRRARIPPSRPRPCDGRRPPWRRRWAG